MESKPSDLREHLILDDPTDPAHRESHPHSFQHEPSFRADKVPRDLASQYDFCMVFPCNKNGELEDKQKGYLRTLKS